MSAVKQTKGELIAENEALRHRPEALGEKAGNGGRGETDHQREAEEVRKPNHRLKMGSERIPVGYVVRDKNFRFTE